MQDWNVVVTIHGRAFARAIALLDDYGLVSRTGFYNVLVMRVDDIQAFLAKLAERVAGDPSILQTLARVVPVRSSFTFQTPEEFEEKAREAVDPWVPRLANKTFHVRWHRRGFKGRLSSQEEERFLDGFLLARLQEEGASATVGFDDSDVVVVVETVGQRAGLSLWTREDAQRYPFLRLD